MKGALAASAASEPVVSSNALTVLSALLEARTGQQLASYRSWRIDTALKPLLRARSLPSLDALVAILLNGQDGTIGDQIVDAILNSETSFFRDAAVFALMEEALVGRLDGARRLRIWSAGCSTGQEPLSLAMMFADRDLCPAKMPEIVATDISETALGKARTGRYSQFEIQRGLPIRKVMSWFEGEDGDWQVRSELVRRIQYRRLNLVTEAPPPGRFDAVLCRNVLLYLAPPTKAQAFARLASVMRTGGLLMLGAGETVIGQTKLFVPSATWRGLYERTDEPALLDAG